MPKYIIAIHFIASEDSAKELLADTEHDAAMRERHRELTDWSVVMEEHE